MYKKIRTQSIEMSTFHVLSPLSKKFKMPNCHLLSSSKLSKHFLEA